MKSLGLIGMDLINGLTKIYNYAEYNVHAKTN
jgi:hypothetical protein